MVNISSIPRNEAVWPNIITLNFVNIFFDYKLNSEVCDIIMTQEEKVTTHPLFDDLHISILKIENL